MKAVTQPVLWQALKMIRRALSVPRKKKGSFTSSFTQTFAVTHSLIHTHVILCCRLITSRRYSRCVWMETRGLWESTGSKWLSVLITIYHFMCYHYNTHTFTCMRTGMSNPGINVAMCSLQQQKLVITWSQFEERNRLT